MLKAVAYCRVSTNKDEQLDSLLSQQHFFYEYARRNEYELVHIYADEGKSGTKIKNRTQLLKLLEEAKSSEFDIVLIKDVSRLARNTVDFLTSIRKLKILGVKVVFVNYDQTSSDSSEFMLTLLSAIAQEESANTSKRVKFGKMQNAEKGKVPNLIFGYDKIKGDYFNLKINANEAKVVQEVFRMYIEEGMGTGKIAKELNKAGIKTKRGCNWSQCSVSRLLANEIYQGKVINRKEEVVDFLTGARQKVPKDNRLVVKRNELMIIDEATFKQAKSIMDARKQAFQKTGERESDKFTFSKLLYCKSCGRSFRRIVRTYKNTYIKWVCAQRNSVGTDACSNSNVIKEEELLEEIRKYIISILKIHPRPVQEIVAEYRRILKKKNIIISKKQGSLELIDNKIKLKQKYIEMYEHDIIDINELKKRVTTIDSDIKRLEIEMLMVDHPIRNQIINIDNVNGLTLETIVLPERMTNDVLTKVISRITVDENNLIDIHFNKI